MSATGGFVRLRNRFRPIVGPRRPVQVASAVDRAAAQQSLSRGYLIRASGRHSMRRVVWRPSHDDRGTAAINVRGVRAGARTIRVHDLAKLLPLACFIALGAFAPPRSGLPAAGVNSDRPIGAPLFCVRRVEVPSRPAGESGNRVHGAGSIMRPGVHTTLTSPFRSSRRSARSRIGPHAGPLGQYAAPRFMDAPGVRDPRGTEIELGYVAATCWEARATCILRARRFSCGVARVIRSSDASLAIGRRNARFRGASYGKFQLGRS